MEQKLRVKLPDGRVAKVSQATGMRGVLCFDLAGRVFFRSYGEDGTFVDYDLHHSDLSIVIEEEAAFYEFDDGTNVLDRATRNHLVVR